MGNTSSSMGIGPSKAIEIAKEAIADNKTGVYEYS